MDATKQAAIDLAGSINLTLGWRAADPTFDPQRLRYTGGVVLSQRGAEAVARILDHHAADLVVVAYLPPTICDLGVLLPPRG